MLAQELEGYYAQREVLHYEAVLGLLEQMQFTMFLPCGRSLLHGYFRSLL
jgi:hypothetical protein